MPKTTIVMREDLHEILKQKYGRRGLSKAVNEILARELLKGESMFGTMKKTHLRGLRDHKDRT